MASNKTRAARGVEYELLPIDESDEMPWRGGGRPARLHTPPPLPDPSSHPHLRWSAEVEDESARNRARAKAEREGAVSVLVGQSSSVVALRDSSNNSGAAKAMKMRRLTPIPDDTLDDDEEACDACCFPRGVYRALRCLCGCLCIPCKCVRVLCYAMCVVFCLAAMAAPVVYYVYISPRMDELRRAYNDTMAER